MMWWKKKSIYLLALSVLLATFVWFQIGMFLIHMFFEVNIRFNFFTFCISLFKEQTIYYIAAVYLTNTIIICTLAITLIKLIKQVFLSFRFKKRIMDFKDPALSSFYSNKFGVHNDIYIVKTEQSLAFTMGMRKPFIVLSTGLIELLEEDELMAVIEHEQFHQNNRDPLIIMILQVISQSLWFIPLTKWCFQNYKIICEILADEYAIKKMGSQIGLGSALLKLIRHRLPNKSVPMVVQFSGESINYRLQQLVEPKRAIPVKIKLGTIVTSFYALLIFLGMMYITFA